MNQRTIHNPVTGERATYVQTSIESGGAGTVIDLEVTPGGGVPNHQHSQHQELIEVLEGEIEVTVDGRAQRIGAGQRVVIEPGHAHSWRNPTRDRTLRFRGRMTPGNPGFERFLRVLFGLGRDGQLRKNGMPRRFADLALLTQWDPSVLAGPLRLLAPLMRWSARRAQARAAELLQRYEA